jgi:hypothetical protein
MLKLAAATSFILALAAPGLASAQAAPPSEGLRLAYTTTSPDEVAFMDLASLKRTGDVVQGWSLNIFGEPMPNPFHAEAINSQWSEFTIDCAARTARFTRAVGLKARQVLFDAPFDYPVTPVAQGWELDAAYACDASEPSRPIVTDLDEAYTQAEAIMTSDAWTASR